MFSRCIEQMNATHLAIFNVEVGREFKLQYRDVMQSLCFRIKRAQNFASSRVAMSVQNTVAAMSAFARERQLCTLAVELRPPLKQLFDPFRTFLNQDLRRIVRA